MAPIISNGLRLLAVIGLSSTLAFPAAEPTSLSAASGPPRCEDYGECIEEDFFGYRVQRLVSSTTPSLSAQQASEPRTRLELGSNHVSQRTFSFDGSEPPDAGQFRELIGRIRENCFDSTCYDRRSVQVGAFRLTADGQFDGRDSREIFIQLIEDAMFKSQKTEVSVDVPDTPPTQPGVPSGGTPGRRIKDTQIRDFFNVNRVGGDNSGQFLRMRIINTSFGGTCPAALNALNAAGALVPQLSFFFGAISSICAGLG